LAEESLSKREEVPGACPHCGNKLSPWQQVLLATDRAIVCKKCWYRIILDVIPKAKKIDSDKSKNEGSK
jgi:DNA-directed RNA polymerase subunit RPC12/RpoP